MIIPDEHGVSQIWSPYLNQNFRSHRRVRMLIDRLTVSLNSPALELGPGQGHLTKALVTNGFYVCSVEKSSYFFNALLKYSNNELKSLELIQQEALDYLASQSSQKKLYRTILGIGILHHIWYHPRWSLLLSSNLTPGGSLLFLEPNPKNILAKLIFRTRLGRYFFRLDPKENLKDLQELHQELRSEFDKITVEPMDLLYPGMPRMLNGLITKAERWMPQSIKWYFCQSILIRAHKCSTSLFAPTE